MTSIEATDSSKGPIVSTKPRVLCAAHRGWAHMIPVLSIGKAFRQSGSTVHVLWEGDKLDPALAACDLPRIRVEPSNASSPTPGTQTRGRSSILDIFKVLEEYRPAVTVYDMHFELPFAASIRPSSCRVSILRPALMPGSRGFGRGADASLRLQAANQLALQHGLRTHSGDLHDLIVGDLVVIPSIPEIDPLPTTFRERWPDVPVVYTGPLLHPAVDALPPGLINWIAKRRGEHLPILLVTLGTFVGGEMYDLLYEIVQNAELATVMIVPDARTCDDLVRRANDRVYVTGLTNLAKVAGWADVVLHHGSTGTALEVLLAGKPSLTLPSVFRDRGYWVTPDVADNVTRLTELGCSHQLGTSVFSGGAAATRELVSAVCDMATDTQAQSRVRSLQASVASHIKGSGPAAVVAAVEKVLARGVTEAPRRDRTASPSRTL